MATTREDIKRWIDEKPEACTHMLVVCDTFDYTDYPLYFPHSNMKTSSLEDVYHAYNNTEKMSRVMEVYSFTGTISVEDQLAEGRAVHFD